MNSDLKTLNDLIVVCDICKKHPENNCHHPCCRNNKRVRQEAIKWVKEKYHPDKDTMKLTDWIDFFNITEEELK